MTRAVAATAIALSFAAVAAGCKPTAPGVQKSGPAVAQGDGILITADELKARLDEQSPFLRQRYQTLDRKKEFLDSQIRFELLARAAEKEGLASDPDVQLTMKKAMVQKMLQKRFSDADGATIPDAEVQKYYESHRDDYVKAPRIRLAGGLVAAGPADRAAKAAQARKALSQIQAAEKKDPLALQAWARQSSDDAPSKAAGGDLGFRSQAELAAQYGPALADAAAALKEGQTVLVETPAGFWILRLLGRQEGVERTMEQVKTQISAQLLREKRTKAFDDYVKKLREDSHVTVNDAELEKVQVSQGGAPGMPGMPGPGGMPAMPGPGGMPRGAMPPPAPAPH
jgi:peptidyl-prolyl cis-trans isomerase C